MKKFTIAAVSLFLTTSAHAFTVGISPADVQFPSVGTYETFDNLPTTTSIGPFVSTDENVSFSGDAFAAKGFSSGNWAAPYLDETTYLGVFGNTTETLTYKKAQTSFGLYWGSLDPSNSLTFVNSTTHTIVGYLDGNSIGGLSPTGGWTDTNANRYVTVSNVPKFDQVVIGSGQNSFEFDNVTTGVPETSTYLMMFVGFISLFYLGRKKSTFNFS